eukprot:m.284533 g.284533  ORF g.284533 m.284533 type:complete len:494 (+) comp40679_c1_seq14:1253-2734(+)
MSGQSLPPETLTYDIDFEKTLSSLLPSQGDWQPCSKEERDALNGCRITVFGEPRAGSSSFSRMLAAKRNSMKGYKPSHPSTSLNIHNIFSNDDEFPGTVFDVEGLGSLRKTGLESSKKDVLSQFRTWRRLVNLGKVFSGDVHDDWQRLYIRAALHLQDIEDDFGRQLGLLLSERVVYICSEQTLVHDTLDAVLEKLHTWLTSVRPHQAAGAKVFPGSVRITRSAYVLVNRSSMETLMELKTKYRRHLKKEEIPSSSCWSNKVISFLEVGGQLSSANGPSSESDLMNFSVLPLLDEKNKAAVNHNRRVACYLRLCGPFERYNSKWASKYAAFEQAASCVPLNYFNKESVDFVCLKSSCPNLLRLAPICVTESKLERSKHSTFIVDCIGPESSKETVQSKDGKNAKVTITIPKFFEKNLIVERVQYLCSGDFTEFTASSASTEDPVSLYNGSIGLDGRYEFDKVLSLEGSEEFDLHFIEPKFCQQESDYDQDSED